MNSVNILPSGDSAVNVEFENVISPEINDRVRAFCAAVENAGNAAVSEVVPTYRSALVFYDYEIASWAQIRDFCASIVENTATGAQERAIVTVVPVKYGGIFGPDLEYVAQNAHMSEGDIIRIHSGGLYRVYMLGFTPGFPYLGGMDARIACPRRETPRTRIPRGSVGIAGSQTGVYPQDTPGGWQLIGRTPLEFYDPARPAPALVQAGSYIKFKPVDDIEYAEIAAAVAENAYEAETHPL